MPGGAPASEADLQDGQVLTKTFTYQDENLQTVQVTRKVRIHKQEVKVPEGVYRRRTLPKFGKCKGQGRGPEPGNTRIDDNIELVLGYEKKVEAKPVTALDTLGKGGFKVVCRNCGENHLTYKCPYPPGQAQKAAEEEAGRGGDRAGAAAAAAGGAGAAPGPGKYIPLHLREGAVRREAEAGEGGGRREGSALRVSNLSVDVKDSDLHDLFKPFGPLQRVYVARDSATGQGRGFAYVTFMYREDAERAFAALNEYRYDHMILHLEWALSRP